MSISSQAIKKNHKYMAETVWNQYQMEKNKKNSAEKPCDLKIQ